MASTAVSDPTRKTGSSDPNDKKAGIAWAGSLVGSLNPNNLGYRYSSPLKRYRLATDSTEDGGRILPTNIQIQFCNRQGQDLANTLDVPVKTSVDDLNELVHSLRTANPDDDAGEGRVPYSFYAKIRKANQRSTNLKDHGKEEDDDEDFEDIELTGTLEELLLQFSQLSTETVLTLTYQPLAIFRVRPVTRCTSTLTGHTEAILHVSFAPHGRLLASGGGDTVVRFWDVLTATPKFSSSSASTSATAGQHHKNHVLCTAWSPDGQRFVSADKNGVWIVWDPTKGQPSAKPVKAHKQWITGLAWEPAHLAVPCERLVTSSKDATLKIWNVRAASCSFTLSGHTDAVEAVRWTGSALIVSASRDRTIKVWNPDRGILVRTLAGHGHRINTLALSSDSVLRTGPFDPMQAKNSQQQQAADLQKAAKERYDHFLQHHGGQETLVSGSDDFTMMVWHFDSSKHALKRLTGHQQAVNHIAFSPDGRYFASASFDKKVKLWNGFTGDFLLTLTGHVGAVYQVAWSPDSRFLVSASKDSTAKLWQVPSGITARETLPGHADEVYALDWSPTGACVATGSKDRTIKIWKH